MPQMTLFLIAGEASGDLIGSGIIQGLRHHFPALNYMGIGGPRMEEAGHFRSLFPFSKLSHMGLGAILKRLPSLWRLLGETTKAIHHARPVGLLTIDSPEFCLRVSRRIRGIPRMHCVPPAVWAWRPKRALALQKATDLVLSLFPFEAPFFTHMPYAFLGHPILEHPKGDALKFWQGGPAHPLLCLLPGSREREIRNFLPVFLETAQRLLKAWPGMKVVLPTFPHLMPYVAPFLQGVSQEDFKVVTTEEDKRNAFAASTVALAASGSVSLELAFQGTPMVIGYRVPRLTEWVLRRLLTTSSVALINIVAQEPFVPECLQDRFTPDVLFQEVLSFFKDPSRGKFQKDRAAEALCTLQGQASFSALSAQTIGSFLKLPSSSFNP